MIELRRDDLHWREVDGEVVALDLRRGRYLGINRSGRMLWQGLAEGATRDDLIEALRSTYGLEHGRAASDVDNFLAVLRSHQLIAGDNGDST
jgi:hypothetical protein